MCSELTPSRTSRPSPAVVVTALGFTTLLGYGSSYYLPAILAAPISADTGWPLHWVVGGLSVGLLAGGIAAPRIGCAVDQHGGRRVLSIASLLLAVGLLGLGLARSLPAYLLAWCVIGLGMGAGLYDAAFAALGGWYREKARAPITIVTLFGGLASTLCWPLSAYLVATLGWRSTCFFYAAVHLLVALPLHARLLPGANRERFAESPLPQEEHQTESVTANRSLPFLLVAVALTLAATITSIVSVHLLSMLQTKGHTLAAAVAIGTLIGPSQIIGRAVELAWGRMLHPIGSGLISAALMGGGVAGLTFDLDAAGFAVAVYAAGAGVSFVVRGTLPLALFGPRDYGRLMGWLGLPSLIAQALAPWLATIVLARTGADTLLAMLLVMSIAHVAVIAALHGCTRTRR
jgi:predicted MFS family arabinose efflux permease